MELRFYNTLNRCLEEFTPIQQGVARMYTCGPTVYNFAHIGNFRAYLFEDILRRVLKFCGYQVVQVMNLTDIDDKTIRDSQASGMALNDFTAQYKAAFFDDLKTLRVEPAEHYPAATDHIPEMISLIEKLMEKGYGYVGEDGSVYFSIRKFGDYGRLARIDLEGQRVGVRIQADEYEKDQAADFALWKKWDEADGDVGWDSPWGKGRPGWHIECSAMSMKYLGNHFDLHTGGVDNMFPHHEDEIAQSEAATGEPFVNYWLHCEHLMVNNSKMSKSAGNFFTLRDLLNGGYSGREVRWLLMSAHYRQKLNFTYTAGSDGRPVRFDGLDNARIAIRRVDEFACRLRGLTESVSICMGETLAETGLRKFRHAVEDDLNISGALGALFEMIRDANRAMDSGLLGRKGAERILALLYEFDTVLGVLDLDSASDIAPAEVLALAEERKQARKNKDFARSDQIRDQLKEMGWEVKDTPEGPKVTKL
ncbi:MAG: cysteine--tRNA ligase [Planctomycetota bacterium]